MSEKLLSIVIPVYNAGEYLEKCLCSILNQTFADFEVLCINDYSEDNSLEILNEYSKKDERIIIINNEKNLGAALTRNVGLEKAEGKYIYFIDADDYIDENYLEVMVQKIEQEKCDIILNMSILAESNGNITQFRHPSMPEINPDGEYLDKIATIHDAPCFLWARIYRRDFLNEHNLRFLNIHATEDVVFNAIVNLETERTFVFYGPKYHYNVVQTGLTGTVKSDDNRDLQHIKAHDLIYDYLKKHNKLDNRLKLFRVYPFIKVDSREKFDCYKQFFEKIESDFKKNENIYNELEKFFANSLLTSPNYEEYLKNYNKIVTIGFLRRGKK
ncbi:glycosyltransferase family 2 protein [bacterium]|nr:glycosyltransferase family 2 protein [bacterium]